MAQSFDSAIKDADAILLLVKHTEFTKLKPDEIAAKTKSRILIDCVSAWDTITWSKSGFKVYRLGVNKPPVSSL